jgi:SAM-dependent methyltransferase
LISRIAAEAGIWSKINREIRVRRNKKRRVKLDPLTVFGPFIPAGSGSWEQKSKIAINAISALPGLLGQLSVAVSAAHPGTSIKDFQTAAGLKEARKHEARLEGLLNRHKSDKSSRHDYHRIYAALFPDVSTVKRVVEIGIGSPNPRFVSTMGEKHTGAGGSLRAFRDYFPNAEIFGFDIDEDALFCEDRLQTSLVDQTDSRSLEVALSRFVADPVDLFIDDGLHSIDANLRTLIAGLRIVRPGGWLCIEDIDPELGSLWELIASYFRDSGYRAWVVNATNGMVFVTQRD